MEKDKYGATEGKFPSFLRKQRGIKGNARRRWRANGTGWKPQKSPRWEPPGLCVTLSPSSPPPTFPRCDSSLQPSLFARRQSHRSRAKPIVHPVSCKFLPLAVPPERRRPSCPLISSGAVIFTFPNPAAAYATDRNWHDRRETKRSLARAKFDFEAAVSSLLS